MDDPSTEARLARNWWWVPIMVLIILISIGTTFWSEKHSETRRRLLLEFFDEVNRSLDFGTATELARSTFPNESIEEDGPQSFRLEWSISHKYPERIEIISKENELFEIHLTNSDRSYTGLEIREYLLAIPRTRNARSLIDFVSVLLILTAVATFFQFIVAITRKSDDEKAPILMLIAVIIFMLAVGFFSYSRVPLVIADLLRRE